MNIKSGENAIGYLSGLIAQYEVRMELQPIFIIDIEDIPKGFTVDEFVKMWDEHLNSATIINNMCGTSIKQVGIPDTLQTINPLPLINITP